MSVSSPQHPHSEHRTELRGFAIYVGLSEADAAPAHPTTRQPGTERCGDTSATPSELVSRIKELIATLAPTADTYAAVALAPAGVGGRDIDIVRLALGEPAAVTRQKQHSVQRQDRATSGVAIDLSRGQVLLDNNAAALTFREFALLKYLVLREGHTVSREQLLTQLWSDAPESEPQSARTIDVHIRRLRVKLASYQDIVRTVRGVGYRFDRHADVTILYGAAPSPDRF